MNEFRATIFQVSFCLNACSMSCVVGLFQAKLIGHFDVGNLSAGSLWCSRSVQSCGLRIARIAPVHLPSAPCALFSPRCGHSPRRRQASVSNCSLPCSFHAEPSLHQFNSWHILRRYGLSFDRSPKLRPSMVASKHRGFMLASFPASGMYIPLCVCCVMVHSHLGRCFLPFQVCLYFVWSTSGFPMRTPIMSAFFSFCYRHFDTTVPM